ncbi:hypothetical protein LCGC14_0868060 [marine sediment metagenome]|uniref:Cytotoxic translational repressor of toxin-antitoxin stability system n=1 Tax=marine sediment metagenome TaxID=412755 RepID=A0A0F9PA94_9ZZZZ
MDVKWEVFFTRKADKQLNILPNRIYDIVLTLVRDIEIYGPVRVDWPNFGVLRRTGGYHCHLKKGRPTYVAFWVVIDGNVEVIYVGTHEKAPY